MQKSDIFPALQQKLNDVQATVKRISTHAAELPTLERDIALKQVQQLYELLLQIECSSLYKPEMQKIEKPKQKVEIETTPAEKITKIKPEKKVEKLLEKFTETPVKQEIKKIEAGKETPIKEEIKTQPSTPAEKQEKTVSRPHKATSELKIAATGNLFESPQETVSEKFKSSKPSVAENLSSGVQDKSIVAQLQRKKISDIRSGIGVNDKFLFINELFSGEFKKYEEIVDKINTITDSEEAFELLDSIKEKYNWRDDLPAFRKMMSIIERKFI